MKNAPASNRRPASCGPGISLKDLPGLKGLAHKIDDDTVDGELDEEDWKLGGVRDDR